jgi:hypothetical protein
MKPFWIRLKAVSLPAVVPAKAGTHTPQWN